ncbi:hypothetical protein PFISCL1PPCAC_15322, partial [Pristionchus fissidentatus]
QRVEKSESGLDILHLVRRSSGVDSRASDSSPIPDNALVGLSEAEKEHVRKVLENSRKSSQSPATSRRPSSALPLQELGDFSDSERAHIQQVLDKAESRGSSPFVIRVPSRGRMGRTDSAVSYDTPTPPPGRIHTQASFSDDDYNSSMRSIDHALKRATERQTSMRKSSDNSPKESKQEEDKEKIRSTTEILSQLPATLDVPTETPILTPRTPDRSPDRSHSRVPRLEKVEEAPKSPEISIMGIKNLFGKTTSSVMSMTKKVSPQFVTSQGEELTDASDFTVKEQIKKIEREEKTTNIGKNIEAELTEEELDHIRKMNEMAEQLEKELTWEKIRPIPVSQQPQMKTELELTIEEMEHLRRMEKMAELQPTVIKQPSLTEEEMEHIRRATEAAEEMEMKNMREIEEETIRRDIETD